MTTTLIQDMGCVNHHVDDLMHVKKLEILGATPITLDTLKLLTNLTELTIEREAGGMSDDECMACFELNGNNQWPCLRKITFKTDNRFDIFTYRS